MTLTGGIIALVNLLASSCAISRPSISHSIALARLSARLVSRLGILYWLGSIAAQSIAFMRCAHLSLGTMSA